MSRTSTLKRGNARRPVPQRRKPKVTIGDRILSIIPVSERTLHHAATWSIFALGMGAIVTVASLLGVPGAVGTAIAEGIGRAGFRV
nr:cell division protein FtsQ [Pseudomonadota bacterium]